MRAFNVVQMTHFIAEGLSSYYVRRLLDYASNRQQRPPAKFPAYEGQLISALGDDVFKVASSCKPGETYIVNVAACMCSCHEGITGKVCKHIHYVHSQCDMPASVYHLNDIRELMYVVANGTAPPAGWLDLLHGGLPDMFVPPVNAGPSECLSGEQVSSVTSASSSNGMDTGNHLDELNATLAEFCKVLGDQFTRFGARAATELNEGCKSAIETLKGVNSTNSMVSALYTFGKYSVSGQPSGRVRAHALGRIPVQTTAVARRKKCLRGSAPGEAGRPRKTTIVVANKHDYAMPSRNFRAAASHSLSRCVRQNIALGGTHSKK
jgi:hypothetical protein